MFYLLCKSRELVIEIHLLLFDVNKPILLCRSEVWVYENNDFIKSLHLEFCKYIVYYEGVKSAPQIVL